MEHLILRCHSESSARGSRKSHTPAPVLRNFASLGGLSLTTATIQVLEDENITNPIHLRLLMPGDIEKPKTLQETSAAF